jgi:hypothetical protein
MVMAGNIKTILQLYPQHLNTTLKSFSRLLSESNEQFKSVFEVLHNYFIECGEGDAATLSELRKFARLKKTPL